MTTIRTHSQLLPVMLTQEEILALSRELAHTVQTVGAEAEHQKNLKDSMKAKMSELQARMTRISLVVAAGTEYRQVEVEYRLTAEGLIQEVRLDTGEIQITRPPHDSERQLILDMKEATP